MTNDHDHADNSIRKSIGMSGYGDAPFDVLPLDSTKTCANGKKTKSDWLTNKKCSTGRAIAAS